MRRQFTGIDVGMIVTGSIQLVLTICLFGVVGAIIDNTDTRWASGVPSYIQLGVAFWYLVTSVLAIAAGVTGHRGPYVSVIVMTVLAILISLAAGIVAALIVYVGIFETVMNDASLYSTTTDLYTQINSNAEVQRQINAFGELGTGVMVINFLSFVLLIVISSLGCCGTCCNNPPVPVQQSTTIITTSGGYAPAPPGYVTQPPAGQQYSFQGMSNPNYDNTIAMDPYKS